VTPEVTHSLSIGPAMRDLRPSRHPWLQHTIKGRKR
jgi:hypothetical protein